MPPYSFQALVRASARTQEAAQAFLLAASRALPEARGLIRWVVDVDPLAI